METLSSTFYVFQTDSEIVNKVYQEQDNYLIEFDEKGDKEWCAVYFCSNDIYYPNTEEIFRKRIIEQNFFEWYHSRINKAFKHIVSIRPTTGIKPLYTTIATVTMNLIVSAAIVLLNPYVTVYISYKIPPFALSVHIPDVSTSIYVAVDSKVLLGLPFCDKASGRLHHSGTPLGLHRVPYR